MIIYKNIFRFPLIVFIGFMTLLEANPNDWYRNTEMATLYEAMTKISSESLYIEKKQIVPKNILKSYIHKIDLYGDYFTKSEYKAFQEMLSAEYAGVGMILYQEERNGKILCIPSSKYVEEEGVSKYDELISVDGRSVKGKNFYLVSSWIRGRKNSSVVLEILKSSGSILSVKLKRSKQHFQSTQKVIENGIAMIQIMRFTSETPKELQRILNQWPKNIPIVIDLRGNGGGDLFASISSADLLLPRDTLISSIETKGRHIDYHASSPDIVRGRAVFVLQDKFTASAAEVFIAALTQNNRVQSIGERTLGKGVAQKFIPLSNGDALLLTYGIIIAPNGQNYHKSGLIPTSDNSLEELLNTVDLSLY